MNIETVIEHLIPVEEYFRLASQEEELTPEETQQKEAFEEFIDYCTEYIDFLTPAAEAVYGKYKTHILGLNAKGDKKTEKENKIVQFYDQHNTFLEEEKEETYGTSRKLSKAGYVDATVILVVLLNVGFIIAMAILGMNK